MRNPSLSLALSLVPALALIPSLKRCASYAYTQPSPNPNPNPDSDPDRYYRPPEAGGVRFTPPLSAPKREASAMLPLTPNL